jgi:hypothetical protein
MFRIWKKVDDTTWVEQRSLTDLWSMHKLEKLWNGEVVEWLQGQYWTLSVPEGHKIIPFDESSITPR